MSKEIKKLTGLELLRSPFPANQVSKLPKPTKDQTEKVKADYKQGIRCADCGAWHHKDVVHLNYVGHAALTDRLLDSDPSWYWEPLSFKDGLPQFDSSGGLWIKLTVGGVTRLGYGHAEQSNFKEIGSREKEVIGDALRNAAMRFGAALDLWHKGDLHLSDDVDQKEVKPINTDAAIAGHKTESAQSDEAGEFVNQFGAKHKGKKIKDILPHEHDSMIKWLEGEQEKGQYKIKSANEYLKYAKEYLSQDGFGKEEPLFDESEQMPS